MNLFNSELNNKIIRQLQAARQNFEFDQAGIKKRLLSAMDSPQSHPLGYSELPTRFTFIVLAGVATTILAATATFLIAAESAPGDSLFAVNKFREQLILSLPLAPQKRIEVTADIVQSRFEAVDRIDEQDMRQTGQLMLKRLETVNESRASFQQAVDAISLKQTDLEQTGQNQAATALDSVLSNLTQMADKRAEVINKWVQRSDDQSERYEIRSSLKLFEQTRDQARQQLNRRYKQTPTE